MSASEPNTKAVADATVEVGRVFGEGGTDGLILYALILATFLMFLAVIAVVLLLRRSMASLDNQAKAFASASEKSAAALTELATALADASGQDRAHQQMVAMTLGQLQPLIADLNKRREGSDAKPR